MAGTSDNNSSSQPGLNFGLVGGGPSMEMHPICREMKIMAQ